MIMIKSSNSSTGSFPFRKAEGLGLFFSVLFALSGIVSAQESSLLAWWNFEDAGQKMLKDSVSGEMDALQGNFRAVEGIGQAVKFDGYTTIVTRKARQAPAPGTAFTIEAWVALAAYPWSWCPILSHTQDNAGYALEIGPDGELAMKIFSGSAWRTCISRVSIPLRTWAHVAGVFDPESGLRVYKDGQEIGRLEFQGNMTSARRTDLVIGSVSEPTLPAYIHREHGTLPGWYSLDAILDEIKIHGRALSAEDLIQMLASVKPSSPPDIPPRVLPSGPPGPGRFGAYYTHLKYYWEWDDLWRVAEHPDVVVQFENSPVRVVFWRGTRFSPAWVSENNLWMADQSVETWNDEEGCFEHMQDRHTRYSHVRILENTPARVVVHWRYAPTSAYDNHWNVDPRTGWGTWIDEYYYFYPDQTGIRKYTWTKGSLGRPRQFQESIPLTGPGQVQGDVINEQYVTVANLNGEKLMLYYKEDPPRTPDRPIPENPMIQMHNFKADNNPFIIFEPGGRMNYVRDMNISALSRPGSCSHWPVGQMCCDGRTQRTIDRAASFLGFPITDPVVHEDSPRHWVSSLYGMNDQPFERLVPLARSWIQAPKLQVKSGNLKNPSYDFSQRAYILETLGTGSPSAELVLAAGTDSPFHNACLVIKGWGESSPQVSLDSKALAPGRDYRVGYVRTLEGTDLLVWISHESTKPVTIVLAQSDDRVSD